MSVYIFFTLSLIVFVLLFLVVRKELKNTGDVVKELKEKFPLIEQKLESNKETFSNSLQNLHETTRQIIPVVSKLSESLGRISGEWNSWEKAIQKVTDIFSDTVKKGVVGEFLLEHILSSSLPPYLWQRQFNIDGKRVDAAVFLKGKELILPIDSKFPLQLARNFLTSPEGEKRKAWRVLKKEVESLGEEISKKYIRPDRGTTTFAALFVPTEDILSLLSSPLDPFGEKNDLLSKLQRNKIVLVGPSSIYAFVSLAIAGYQAYSMGKRIEEFLNTVQTVASILESINKLGALIEKKAREISGNAGKILTHTSEGLGRLRSVNVLKKEEVPEEGKLPLEGESPSQDEVSDEEDELPF